MMTTHINMKRAYFKQCALFLCYYNSGGIMNKYCLNCCDWINKDREDNPLELCDNCLDNKEYD